MSGICGIIRFDDKPVNKETIQRMLDTMKIQGSDTEGIWIDGSIGLGHKMLCTTPESLYEKQPLISEDENLVLAADIRLDNRSELIEKLGRKATNFDKITDADLILWSYQKWGKHCPSYLNGDFAFAIWNNKEKKLFVSRDRFGVRQLYYYYNKEILIFATSIEPIFASGFLNRVLDIQSVKKYIKFMALDRSESFFEEIKRLPSSNWMTISKNQFKMERYWYPEKIQTNSTISLEEAAKEFSTLFHNAVKSSLRSSHPLSVELSGGLDSSSIYSVAISMGMTQRFTAHTMQHKGLASDETYYIQQLEKKFKSDILKFDINEIDFTKYNLSNFYAKFPNIPQRGNFIEFVMKNRILSKRGTRVVITGMGADEVLGGDDSFMLQHLKDLKFVQLFKTIRCIGRRAQSKSIFIKFIFSLFFVDRLKESIHNTINHVQSKLFFKNTLYMKEIELDKEVDNKYIKLFGLDFLSPHFSYWIDFNALQNYSNDGIEVRYPFFDTKLVEFIISLPPEYLHHCGIYKNILKLAMDGIVPDSVLYRNNKTSLVPGIELQMKQIFTDSNISHQNLINLELLKEETSAHLTREYFSGNMLTENLLNLWTLCNLENWLEINRNEGKDEKKL
ncbi:asparagine synthase-related protein [Sulfurovum sp. AR]|uniref:asparagine synthase-related protein n=1 Tax=Sulfurovum sp. AR TaxID=1165841 RepID=UPI00025C4D76|nr:asparagine synthase-related protein [Sulfurovum sp. AR]EIF51109.1 asparagine synthase [Sulfurovum sp. AR]